MNALPSWLGAVQVMSARPAPAHRTVGAPGASGTAAVARTAVASEVELLPVAWTATTLKR
eukprot:2330425-Prymnesium_polylepis.1